MLIALASSFSVVIWLLSFPTALQFSTSFLELLAIQKSFQEFSALHLSERFSSYSFHGFASSTDVLDFYFLIEHFFYFPYRLRKPKNFF
jgi:hypothetical protein